MALEQLRIAAAQEPADGAYDAEPAGHAGTGQGQHLAQEPAHRHQVRLVLVADIDEPRTAWSGA